MEIKGKVWCMFEQSGTFKQEFIKLGIQNNFGQTDMQIDLFEQIEKAYTHTHTHTHRAEHTIFDDITEDDLIMAFFPCIEFSCVAQMWFSLTQKDYAKWSYTQRVDYMLEKNNRRAYMYGLLCKLCCVSLVKGIRMVFENPWSENTYLKQNVFLKPPSLIDKNRTRRGDYYKKPTAYWFWNCEPTKGCTIQQTPSKMIKSVSLQKKAPKAGLCSEERSMISPDYARNFICDFILGKEQKLTQLSLF